MFPSTLEIPENIVCLSISAIRRIPDWIMIDLRHKGNGEDISYVAVTGGLQEFREREREIMHLFLNQKYEEASEVGKKLPKSIYNAAQRALYRFLKDSGYRKRSVEGNNNKRKAVWYTAEYLERNEK